MITSLSSQIAPAASHAVASRRIRQDANSFSTQLSAGFRAQATAGTNSRAGRLAAAVQATRASAVKTAVDKTSPVSRQDSVTAAKATAVSSTPISSTPVSSTPIPSTPSTFTDTQSAMQALSRALQAAGIDPTSLGLNGHDDTVSFPGSNGWVNHEITLQAGSHTENFSADLVARNPEVAVTEIQRLLAMG